MGHKSLLQYIWVDFTGFSLSDQLLLIPSRMRIRFKSNQPKSVQKNKNKCKIRPLSQQESATPPYWSDLTDNLNWCEIQTLPYIITLTNSNKKQKELYFVNPLII